MSFTSNKSREAFARTSLWEIVGQRCRQNKRDVETLKWAWHFDRSLKFIRLPLSVCSQSLYNRLWGWSEPYCLPLVLCFQNPSQTFNSLQQSTHLNDQGIWGIEFHYQGIPFWGGWGICLLYLKDEAVTHAYTWSYNFQSTVLGPWPHTITFGWVVNDYCFNREIFETMPWLKTNQPIV